ncbi:radixin-like [Camellia sinensis]|uniref:radixin-like n=1 Tax=Camellia sinensis TaxID=4442 RepID=UPI0010368E38|nr:radixin-like [Camellia sinensis]
MANDSAEDINVGVALSTTLLLPSDLDRNAELSEYENYALMLQRSVQLAEKKREVSSLQKTNKNLQSKMKTLEDQAEVAIKAKDEAEEKVGAAEAINKVLQAQLKEAEDKVAQAQEELQDALATKEVEIKDANEKAYAQGMADVTEAYEKQVKQACNKGFSLGWMTLLKKLDVPEDSSLRNADAIPLPFPPTPPPSQSDSESDSEDEAKEEVLGEEVPKDTAAERTSVVVPLADKSLDETLAEIDAELAADKAAEMSSQQSSELQTQPTATAEES